MCVILPSWHMSLNSVLFIKWRITQAWLWLPCKDLVFKCFALLFPPYFSWMLHRIWLTCLMDFDISLGDACWCLSAARGPVSSTCRFAHLHPDSSLCKCELICLWKWLFFFLSFAGKTNWSHSWGNYLSFCCFVSWPPAPSRGYGHY